MIVWSHMALRSSELISLYIYDLIQLLYVCLCGLSNLGGPNLLVILHVALSC